MSDAVQIAIASNLGNVIIAIGTLATVIFGYLSNRRGKIILAKAEEIHVVTNGHLSTVTSDLKIANDRIAGLEKIINTIATKMSEPSKVTLVDERRGIKE